MVLILLIIFVFVFAWSMVFLPTGIQRTSWNIISFIVIASTLIMIVLNDNYHWGMHQVTTTQSVRLLPLKSSQAALGIKKLGTGNEKIAVYRTVLKPKQIQHTSATATTTVTLKTGSPATVAIKTKRWRYSHLAEVWFSLGQPDGTLVTRHYNFTLPSNWHTVPVTAKTK